jgi:2-hydroxy-6-oxonona-2,4-dienedioate hydrolase
MSANRTLSASASAWLDWMGSGVKENYYDVNGIRTRVLEAGTGPAVVLLHGTGGHAETYQRNLPALATDYHVIVPDMIGHGYTDRPDVSYSLDDFATHLFGLLDVLDLDSVNLSGESLGGCVAAWMALHRPERVDRLMLNTGILDRPDEDGLVQLADLEQRTQRLRSDLSLDLVRRRLEWLVLDPRTMTEEMVHLRYAIYSQAGMVDSVVRVTAAVLAMNRGVYEGVDYLDRRLLAGLRVPTQVLWTDHNPGKPLEVIKPAIDLIPNVEFHLVENAAHWPQFEQPDVVNGHMRNFLAGSR